MPFDKSGKEVGLVESLELREESGLKWSEEAAERIWADPEEKSPVAVSAADLMGAWEAERPVSEKQNEV